MPPPNTPRRSSSVDSAAQSHLDYLDLDLGEAVPNIPTSAYSLSPSAPRQQHLHLGVDRQPGGSLNRLPEPNLPHTVDFRGLNYADTVDENLLCPICRVPMVEPVDTACDHTFCKDCITEAFKYSNLCPIDRFSLTNTDLHKAHKIVTNQLDALLVLCPCCTSPVPRAMILNHLERYCKDALVRCPGQACRDTVKRKLYGRGCLHYDVSCPDCNMIMQQLEMADHRERDCQERLKDCSHCGDVILRCKEDGHLEKCQYVPASCEWAEYGCDYESRRKDLAEHADVCAFKFVGPMATILKKEINNLRSEVRTLTEKDHIKERRIKFLEGGFGGQRDTDRPLDYADLPSQSLSNLADSSHADPLDSGHEYLLSLVEAQETKVDRLSAGMTELEAKQTMMLFNETIQIKNELAEMRSSQQVLSMHVRWLLNFRRQENQRRFGAGPSSGGGTDGGGSSHDMPFPRRLSDTMNRDLVTKL
ncbi:RING finger 84 [Hyphodiscus hymeniophilus]|uniref:RING finger 84 n=1 Tax=Hyphodiscus hymeniophilus TaxID=353542 RepID=A0A9P7B010_9HELO|nr:RING finger 84 [Hyphodiscus hymeniophilus]